MKDDKISTVVVFEEDLPWESLAPSIVDEIVCSKRETIAFGGIFS